MKNLIAYANECLNELHSIGIYPNDIADWKVNTRAKSRWGQCSYESCFATKIYTIQIASCLLDDSAPVSGLKETILHELLHAVDGCMNHGAKWQSLANKVNMAYGYHIKRTNSYAEKGFEENPLKREADYKYRIICTSCNSEWHYMRDSKIVKACRYGTARCSCGAKAFKVFDL